MKKCLERHARGLALLSLILLGGGCRETAQPQPKNRAEASKLEKQGHSFAARNRPAWVDEPRPASRPAVVVPPGWVQAGRGSWVLGRMELRQAQSLDEIAGDPKTLEGKRVRMRAPIRGCPNEKTLAILEASGHALVARLPGELPEGVTGRRAVVEGELRRPASEEEGKAAGRCLGKERAPLILRASGALVHLPSGSRRR